MPGLHDKKSNVLLLSNWTSFNLRTQYVVKTTRCPFSRWLPEITKLNTSVRSLHFYIQVPVSVLFFFSSFCALLHVFENHFRRFGFFFSCWNIAKYKGKGGLKKNEKHINAVVKNMSSGIRRLSFVGT